MIDIKQLLLSESKVIDGLFRRNSIYAKVDPTRSVWREPTSGFIRYALKLRADQRFDEVERLQRELSVALSRHRCSGGLTAIQAIPLASPDFALEVPHPAPVALQWSGRALTQGAAHTMLIGQSYGALVTAETINLASAEHCHVLIAGVTGSGKSVLLQHALLSLTANTSPADLKIMLVDLKNEDLTAFKNLPHVLTFAGTKDQAIDAINFVYDEKQKRVAREGYKPYRLLLLIDELAQLACMKACVDMLGDLASIGRSKKINLIAATQHPTEKGGLGSLLKANFPVRLVGAVAPGQSYAATGRPKVYADLLPGKGAFLRIQGPAVQRFQSFFIEPDDVAVMARKITNHWSAAGYEGRYSGGAKSDMAVDITGYEGGYSQIHTSVVTAQPVSGYASANFPIKAARALTETEAQAVRRLTESGAFDYSGKPSLSKLSVHVYGSKNPERLNWIKEALEGVTV